MSKLSTQKHANAVIKRPRITEKATQLAEKNQFVFEVTPEATKSSVIKAIEQLYKVTPTRVNIVRLPSKTVFIRGRVGTKSAVKKAIVSLKKGDKIDLV